MTDAWTDRRGEKREIAVEYAAYDEVADPDRLCNWLRDELERHLLSITEVPIDGWNLRARIDTCRMAPYHGAVSVALSGTIAGRPLEEVVSVHDEPAPAGYTLKSQRDKATDLAFANMFTFLGRLVLPSELVRALGRRRISGRLVRAWQDCCREIRILIDTAVSRPGTGGERTWRRALRTAVQAGLFFTALSAVEKLLFHPHQADDFKGWLSCGLIGIGVFGAIAASGLLMLPARFYQAEQPGLALVRFFGVKSLAGIRFVAFGLLTISVLFALAPGIYALFFE